ncbi:MAG: serine--tRNA ligase [Candidatus Yonathbacteria bacterium RIFCSPLOWO2_01_FULL_43_27]|uniref:Serine--tRNA ligase n=2 Tax=Parcubacteria group TaxID=1794811 RepID=A0A1G2SD41_9BACT|nr:MAG: Serine-tRNA ligase [Candidatus Azambacteria bacterium GW2011_GWA1_44_9]OHA78880.1 MAG: serine--tRNA ligase [Candidatus Yonathbacteria bacterium RIFCSPHIGHO2_01_FULL_44_19]OHA82957.1 MAG: serine--tRNA ligase [Candidatus Yonathbacteria bacterium RIFCSPLOWO2_01_FULL_43_27]
MLDIKFIRENKELVAAGALKKHINFNVDELLSADDVRRALLAEVEVMRSKQNETANLVPRAASNEERARLISESKELKDVLQKKEEELTEAIKKWQALMVQVPNIPDMSVPEGASDADNAEARTWGEAPKFSFTPKSHIDLMQNLKMLDLERGTKVAGFRGYFLMNDGALLQFALWNFVQDFFAQKGGFVPMIVPSLIRREPFIGTGYLPQSEEDLYKTQDGEYLSGTAEVATMGFYMDETIEKKDLPIKMLSFSPAFRREAGSHGRDTKGIMRVHEFYKLEQVVLCEASHEESVKYHEELTQNTEELMQALGLPYRVVVNCGGDLGLGQVKKYDIEAWIPSENTYRETHSSSYFHDFQTRRLNIRYRDDDGKMRFAHSLNNTALSGRPLIALIENYQNEDGSIRVPEVLKKYIGKDVLK